METQEYQRKKCYHVVSMFELNIFSVFAATFLAIAVGVVWYSPWVFGKPWMRMVGLDESDLEREGQWQRIALGGISQFILFFIVGQLLVLFKVDHQLLRWFTVLISGMALVLLSSSVIWERRPLAYFLITGGYVVTVVAGGMCIIFYWPW